jgi:hypothetical protein
MIVNGTAVVPTINIGNASVIEGNDGVTYLTYTVTLSQASTSPVTVNFATADGTALVSDKDYQAQSGTLTFAAGQTSQTIQVAVYGDLKYETNETVFVQLTNPSSNAVIGTASGTGTIINDDALPALSIGSASILEGNSGETTLAFTVTLSNPSALETTVNFATQSGTGPGGAIAGIDFNAITGTLHFAPGVTSQTINVAIIGDTQYEPNETFLVQLSNATNATIATDTATGTIINDDLAFYITQQIYNDTSGSTTVLPAGSAAFVHESPSPTTPYGITYTIGYHGPQLTAGQTASVTLNLNQGTVNLDTNQDIIGNPGQPVFDAVGAANIGFQENPDKTITFTFTENSTAKEFSFTWITNGNDQLGEPNETMSFNLLSATGASIDPLHQYAETTILANPNEAQISITNYEVNGDVAGATATFDVVCNYLPPSGAVTINYQTVDGTAKGTPTGQNGDYTSTSGQLTFTATGVPQHIIVPISPDTIYEGKETFSLQITSPTNNLPYATGIGTIYDQEDLPIVVVPSVVYPDVTEGQSAQLMIKLFGADGQPFTVPNNMNIQITYHTEAGTATTGVDYQSISNATASIGPGGTYAAIPFSTIDDTLPEPTETFRIVVDSAKLINYNTQGAGPIENVLSFAGNNQTATVNILDNDSLPPPQVMVMPLFSGQVSEGNPAAFNVQLTRATTEDIYIQYFTKDITATSIEPNPDYVAKSETIIIPKGQMFATTPISITTLADNITEPPQQFSLNMKITSGDATFQQGGGSDFSYTTTIVDNFIPPPTGPFTVANAGAIEGQDVIFAVTLTQPVTAPYTINFHTVDGSAIGGVNNNGDYTTINNGTLTFVPGGPMQQFIHVTTNSDTIIEGPENFSLQLSNQDGSYTTVANGAITDPTTVNPPQVYINDVSITEGNTDIPGYDAVFTVKLNQPNTSTSPILINYTTADGTATAGSDYVTTSGTLTFGPGQISQPINVHIIGDTQFEPNQTFFVNLSVDPRSAPVTIVDSQAIGTIINDDTIPVTNGDIIYVQSSDWFAMPGHTEGDGSSWSHPLKLEDALKYGDPTHQDVWLANGNYNGAAIPGSGTLTYVLQNGLDIHGGFNAQQDGDTSRTLGDADNGSIFTVGINATNITTATQIDGITSNLPEGFVTSAITIANSQNLLVENSIILNAGITVSGNNNNIDLTNCVIAQIDSGHTGLTAGGIGNDITLTNCTIADNREGAVKFADGTLTINNSLLWNNTDHSIIMASTTSSSALNITNSAIDPNANGVNGMAIITPPTTVVNANGSNIINDLSATTPFVNATGFDYQLQAPNPYIDAGDNSLITSNTDITGGARVIGDAVNLGAYEHSLVIQPIQDQIP